MMTDRVIYCYFTLLILIGVTITFGLSLITYPTLTVQCAVGSHQVQSNHAWRMDVGGADVWLCDEHLRAIYPRTVGK